MARPAVASHVFRLSARYRPRLFILADAQEGCSGYALALKLVESCGVEALIAADLRRVRVAH